MRNWISVIAAFVLVVSLAACDPKAGGGKPDKYPNGTASVDVGSTGQLIECNSARVPDDRPNLDDKRYITIYGCVERKYAPVELNIFVNDETTGEKGSHNEPSAGNEVQYVIGYDKGHKVNFNVELKPARPGSTQGFLYISDGKGNRHTIPISGGWKVQSGDLFTAR